MVFLYVLQEKRQYSRAIKNNYMKSMFVQYTGKEKLFRKRNKIENY